MCLAIFKPEGTEIPHKNLRNGFENHSDGCGFAWAVDGKLYVRKGIFNVDDMITQYEQVKQYPCLIHFRKATHGKIDAANCHPFLFNDGQLALIHNGVLNIKCSIEGLSDTAHFVKLVLEPMVKLHKVPINDGALNYLISTSIGTDKVAVMDNTGKTFIFNEDKGTWEEGVWYSNTSFRWGKTSSYVYTPTTTPASTPVGFQGGTSAGANTVYDYRGSRQRRNWRRHWEGNQDDDEGDAAYVEFWKRATPGPVSATTVDPKTTRLLAAPKSETAESSGDETVIDVDSQSETVDYAGNIKALESVAAPQYSEGQMCEYGWFDAEVEVGIEHLQNNLGLSREEAIIRIFNDR